MVKRNECFPSRTENKARISALTTSVPILEGSRFRNKRAKKKSIYIAKKRKSCVYYQTTHLHK